MKITVGAPTSIRNCIWLLMGCAGLWLGAVASAASSGEAPLSGDALPAIPSRSQPAAAGEGLTLVANGKSDWLIRVPDEAPASVRFAAKELAEYIEKATGAKLPVVAEAQADAQAHFISLGDTAAARSAGIGADELERDGFRIASHGGNLYINGVDDASAAGNRYFEHISKGTLYGVYHFLENSLGVRWLLPTAIGEDVPQAETLVVEPVDLVFEPAMYYRIIQSVEERKDAPTMLWKLRNRHGYNRRIEHMHNWQNVVPTSQYKTHPEWFAEFGGRRQPPGVHYKLETTNPELVQQFVDHISTTFDQEPERFSFSLSPTDGQGWSQSAESRALDDVTPRGDFSASRRVVSFYNDVARGVARKHPDRLLGGYAYDRYFFPPSQGELELEPNLFIMIAPLQNYGFRLFRPEVRAAFEGSLKSWTKAASHWGYYDLPVTLYPNGVGLITPTSLEIIAYLYGLIDTDKAEASYIYGYPAFGHGGALNYLLARLNWDPSQDPYALAAEFYTRAYGKEAGEIMLQLDKEWEAQFKHYYQNNTASYHITEELVSDLFAPFYPKLEAAYLEAVAAATDPAHAARLEQYGKNLAIMRWILSHRGLIPAAETSPLSLSTAEIGKVIRKSDSDPFVAPTKFYTALSRTKEGALKAEPLGAEATAAVSAAASPSAPMLLRGPSRWLLMPREGEQTQIICSRMPIEEIVSYRILDDRQKEVASGILAEGETITFDGTPGRTYMLDLICSRAAYGMSIEGGDHALKSDGRFRKKLWLHAVQGGFPTLYVFPEKEEFEMQLNSISTGEAFAADLISPSGEIVASFDTSKGPVQHRRISAKEGITPSQPWKLVFRQPESGTSRYAFIQMGEGVSPWMGVSPQQILKVTK